MRWQMAHGGELDQERIESRLVSAYSKRMAMVIFKLGSKTRVETAADYAAIQTKYSGKGVIRHIATK